MAHFGRPYEYAMRIYSMYLAIHTDRIDSLASILSGQLVI
jgi:hypothetical protein